MKYYSTLLFCAFTLSAVAQTSKKDFGQLLKLLPSKYETITAEGMTPKEQQLIDQMTITIAPVEGSVLGKNTFYIKYIRGNGSLYRQRLMTLKYENQQITSESVAFAKDSSFIDFYLNPDKIKRLSQKDLKASLGCADVWTKTGDEFVAKMDSCPFKSERRGKDIYIFSRMMISQEGMGTTEAGKDENGKILFGKLEGYALKLKRVTMK